MSTLLALFYSHKHNAFSEIAVGEIIIKYSHMTHGGRAEDLRARDPGGPASAARQGPASAEKTPKAASNLFQRGVEYSKHC